MSDNMQYGQSQHPGWVPPQQPKKSPAGKIVGFGCLGAAVLFFVVGGCATLMASSGEDMQKTDKPATAQGSAAGGVLHTEAQIFVACVRKNGTAVEKSQVKHVTKVTGTDQRNDILDSAEVWTDYAGDMFGPSANNAKVLASAFVSCYDSDNGLVTVYSKSGEILANANF